MKSRDTEREGFGSVSHPSKCQHAVYWPAADEINMGCQQCNPAGLGAGKEPMLPKSSGDALMRGEARETCVGCGNLRTYFAPECRHCGKPFPEDSSRGVGLANLHQSGSCPECGSAVHYETEKKSVWLCADCGAKFKAPKLKGREA
jgi:hypothetical protein